jgi:hypothetical protein
MAVAVRVIVLTGDGILEETVDVRVGTILTVGVSVGATCPQPANKVIKTIDCLTLFKSGR